jgi:glycosidase
MPKNKNILYEINTPVWLNSLSLKYGHSVTLAEVPDSEIEKLADMGVDCVWLMGIWERSPRAVEIERAAEGHTETFENVLPDFSEDDFIGSAYSVKSYTINSDFGDHESLATLRQNLRNKGIGLILDFVPNHTAPDHQWTADNPDFYIHGGEHAQNEPENYIECSGNVLAKGRDPKFPAWSDVVQVNAFSQGYRQAAISTIKDISEMCDGVRCDMAMLLMNDIFNENWGLKAGNVPETDFWKEIINGVRASSPDFIFLAEVYWGREKDLIDQGFDYCYDKVMYDLLLEDNVDEVNKQLNKTSGYQAGMARFIENHDEPRAAATFIPTGKQKATRALAIS